jgi:hypothetical protein
MKPLSHLLSRRSQIPESHAWGDESTLTPERSLKPNFVIALGIGHFCFG